MEIFYWITGGLFGILLALSAVCWGIFIVMDSRDWKPLAVKLFRWAKSVGLLMFNVWIWGRVLGALFS